MAQKYEWSKLTHLQVGRYAEYFVKMEFTLHGFDVYSAEVDQRGVDFVVRTPSGRFYEIQVKSSRATNYIFFPKDKFRLSETLFGAVVLFIEGNPPELYLIPSLAWQKPDKLLVSRDYDGKKSKPEWGISFTKSNRDLLLNYAFDDMVDKML